MFEKTYKPPQVNWQPKPKAPPAPPTPPKPGAAPAYMRDDRWDSIKDHKAPFGSQGLTVSATTFEYWFDYLWAEAVEADDLTQGDRARLCKAFFSVLSLNGGKPTRVGAIVTMSDEEKQTVLRTLLTIGFKRVSLSGPVARLPRHPNAGPGVPVVKVEQAVDAATLFKEAMAISRDPAARSIKLGFRGDSRTYEQLVASNGFGARARARSLKVYTDYGLDQPWNPFSLEVYANSLFLRKGHNKDNCLHTVVSIASEFAEILPYPLLTDEAQFPLCLKALPSWTDQDIAAAAAHRYKVRAQKGPDSKVRTLENDIRIFIVQLEGARAFSTEAWQTAVGGKNPFPERAVDAVPTQNILAEFEITRRYCWESSKANQGGALVTVGTLAMYDFEVRGRRLLPSEEVLKGKGEDFPALLNSKLDSLIQGAKVKWAQAKRRFDDANRAPVAAAAASTRCGECGATFRNAALLTFHVKATGHAA